MKRRTFIMLIRGAAMWPLASCAQQTGKVFRIGFLTAGASGAEMPPDSRPLSHDDRREQPQEWRIRGELLLRQSAGNAREAERYLATAARIAAEQGALVYGLRAGIVLSRLLAEEGRREEARAVLDRASANPLDEWEGPEIGIAMQLRSELG